MYQLPIKEKSYQKYIRTLSYLYALSRGSVRIKEEGLRGLLQSKGLLFVQCDKKDSYKLRENTKCMCITQIQKCKKIQGIFHYKLHLVESFFTYPKKKRAKDSKNIHSKNSAIRKDEKQSRAAFSCCISLLAKQKLCMYDFLLVKIPIKSPINITDKHLPCYNIPRGHAIKVFTYKPHYTCSLHSIINKNITQSNTHVVTHTDDRAQHIQDEKPQQVLGIVIQQGKNFIIRAFKDAMLLPISVRQKALKALPPLSLVYVENNTITEVLGSLLEGKHDREIAIAMAHYTPPSFSKKALQEAKNIAQSLTHIKGVKLPPIQHKTPLDTTLYYDVSHLPFCTIDPENAKDHDDALYYDSKNGLLYVAISDVSSYVAMGSTLDKEAQKNAFSLYFPNYVFPMLPQALSADACSLVPHKKRLTLIWEFRLHRRSAEVLQSRVFQGIIESKASLHYEQVATFLENPNNNSMSCLDSIQDSLLAFSKLANLLYKKRMQRSIDLDLHDFSFILGSDEVIQEARIHKRNSAHTIVEEAMLLANKASAAYLSNLQYGIYRNHLAPNMRDIKMLVRLFATLGYKSASLPHNKTTRKELYNNNFAGMMTIFKNLQKEAKRKKQEYIANLSIVRHFTKANYMLTNKGHFGLNFPLYTHFTSPIRRYSDIIAHRFIKASLQGNTKQLGYVESAAVKLLAHINKREILFDSIESYYKRLKMLRYAQSILPFDDEALVVVSLYGKMRAIPLHKVSYCHAIIQSGQHVINAPQIIQIRVIGVDFATMSLQAVPLVLDESP